MKKLLVLMLVLGMSGLATAGLSLSWDDATSTISILLDEGSLNLISYDLALTLDAGAFDSAGADLNPSGKGWMTAAKVAAQNEQMFRVTAADIQMFGGTGLAAPNAVLTGLVVNPGPAGSWVTLMSYDAAWADGSNSTGELASVFVPEPMSMLLLGLGGLFLRRRK